MSKVVIKGDASGTGTLTIAAPNTNSDVTFNLPTSGGTMMTTATSLDASQIPDGSITTAKIADANVTTAKIADANVTIAKLSATGTPSSSTFLRGDGSWQSAGGGVTSLNGQTGAITNTDYGAIGSYIVASSQAYTATNQAYGPNVTQAGSTLYRNVDDTNYAISLGMNSMGIGGGSYPNTSLGVSGTWRVMTYQVNGGSDYPGTRGFGLWVRIS